MIDCTNINKVYGDGASSVHALKDVSITIRSGEAIAILGPSGSGKSTLLQILGCLDLPSSGIYTLNGQDIGALNDDDLSELRGKTIGFVFQAFHLFPRFKLIENVALPLVYQGVEEDQRLEQALEALRLVRMDHRSDHFPHQLSGGEKQRGAIARAIVHKPPIILADEPTGNLDSRVKQEILEHFTNLNQSMGSTVVMVTHDDQTAQWARRKILVQDGKIVEAAI